MPMRSTTLSEQFVTSVVQRVIALVRLQSQHWHGHHHGEGCPGCQLQHSSHHVPGNLFPRGGGFGAITGVPSS